ncbi:MAG: sodium:solute symporter [Microscillaceae bacterium]
MSAGVVLGVIALYFGMLLLIARQTSRGANVQTFFLANRQSPWYLVAFGMIGASLSGVTFVSVPGAVLHSQFAYFQMVLGYLVGYAVIALLLLPLYYKLQLTSIYTYLEHRFGFWSYKTGAFFFLLSRSIGSAFRLFLTAMALQVGFAGLGIPFWITAVLSIALIWIYTRRGGIKTIVWTDTFQTVFMLLAVLSSLFLIWEELGWTWGQLWQNLQKSGYTQVWFWDVKAPTYFWKQFLAGAFIAIVMTGLDQDMMQKNLTCRSLADAQKNMFWFSLVLVLVNLAFLTLGALLYLYAEAKGIALPAKTDELYPRLAFEHFGLFAGIMFLLGIVAATYSSADSALAALTTSFCVDFLGIEKRAASQQTQLVRGVHIGFSVLMVLLILLFKEISDAYPNSNVLGQVFTAAGYTYGPLLGLYSFGMFTRRGVWDKGVPVVCVLAPVLAFILNNHSKEWLWGYQFGFEILLVNGLFTFLGLLCLSIRYPVRA